MDADNWNESELGNEQNADLELTLLLLNTGSTPDWLKTHDDMPYIALLLKPMDEYDSTYQRIGLFVDTDHSPGLNFPHSEYLGERPYKHDDATRAVEWLRSGGRKLVHLI